MSKADAVPFRASQHLKIANTLVKAADNVASVIMNEKHSPETVRTNCQAVQAFAALAAVHIKLAEWNM